MKVSDTMSDLVQTLRKLSWDKDVQAIADEAAELIEALRSDLSALANTHARQFDEDSKRIAALEAALHFYLERDVLNLVDGGERARRALEGSDG
jgi:hypothetical protein